MRACRCVRSAGGSHGIHNSLCPAFEPQLKPHAKKKKMFSSSSRWASFQLTPRALLLALGMEHTCTLVRWKQLSGEIAGVTHCSSPHSSFAYFRPAPLIVTGEKVKTLPCPRLNAARCERPRRANWFLEMFWPEGLVTPVARAEWRRGLGWIN